MNATRVSQTAEYGYGRPSHFKVNTQFKRKPVELTESSGERQC